MGYCVVAILTAIPHFTLPFKLRGTRFDENEQDSLDDLVSCVRAVLLYEPGFREMLPEFGVDELTFQPMPIDRDRLVSAIEKWEPRVHALVLQSPDTFDNLILHVQLQISSREA